MKPLLTLIALALCSTLVNAATGKASAHAQKTLEIYRHIVEIDSSAGAGGVPVVADYLAGQLMAAGFSNNDVEVVPIDDTAALVASYRGDGASGRGAILLLGHMDVIGADAADWEHPPFELTQDETHFHGRGTADNKFGIAQLTATFIRLKNEGFVPNRDLFLVFSGDEETSQATTRYLTQERKDIAGAEFALNSDAGGGVLDVDGKPLVYRIQTAEKTYATFEITVRNPGGHSASPREDNAIYDLAEAMVKLRVYRFPVRWNDVTLQFFGETGKLLDGELGETMRRFAENPEDRDAADRLFSEPAYVGSTRTTCIPTMLRAGQAENALPRAATVTVNCRIFPGVGADEVRAVLQAVIGDGEFEIATLDEPIVESPPSPLRADVLAAVSRAVHSRYPGLVLMPYMSSGVTDGMYYRNAGIPTWALSGKFGKPGESGAHGLNERVPVDSFYGALDHWRIILKALAGNP